METGIVSTIIDALTGFVTGSAQAISQGLNELLFMTNEAGGITGISSVGTVIFTMLGIGFGVGLMGVIFSLLRTR